MATVTVPAALSVSKLTTVPTAVVTSDSTPALAPTPAPTPTPTPASAPTPAPTPTPTPASAPTPTPTSTSTPATVTAQANADRGKQVLGEIVTTALVEQTKMLSKMLVENINDVRKADSTLYPKLVTIDERLAKLEALTLSFDAKLNLLIERSDKKFTAGIRMTDPGPAKNMFDKSEQIDLDHD